MASQQRDDDDLDREAWTRAQLQFDRLQSTLPDTAVGTVAREVVRRLAFRMPRFGTGSAPPDAGDIARFCATLTATQESEAERFVRNLRRSGNSVESIYLSYIAAAARELGRQWDEDEISFAVVTMASGRLYRIIRGLRHVLDRHGPPPVDQDRVLLTLLPGDTHTLASEMAADLFRRAGWEIDLSVGEDHDTVVARAEATRFAAIVVVANGIHELAQLTRLVIGLRIVAPMTPVALAGKILDSAETAELCGVDDIIPSLDTAPQRLRAIVGDRTGYDAALGAARGQGARPRD